MHIILAYGLPGSGKTTLLNKLYEEYVGRKHFINFDIKRSKENLDLLFRTIMKSIKEEDLDAIFIDYLFKRKEIINLYDKVDGSVELYTHLEFDIHRFSPNIEQCIINDNIRNREKKATNTIRNMKIKKLSADEFNLSEFTTLNIFEHEVYCGT